MLSSRAWHSHTWYVLILLPRWFVQHQPPFTGEKCPRSGLETGVLIFPGHLHLGTLAMAPPGLRLPSAFIQTPLHLQQTPLVVYFPL